MKPVHELSPEELKNLLFFESKDGTLVPISKIEELSPTSVTIAKEKYTIGKPTYDALYSKLVTYEGIKLMYAQEDLAKQASKLTETSFAENFKQYFDHMEEIIDHVNEQATTVISNLQSTINRVKAKADESLASIEAINTSIAPFRQFAAYTNLSDLKTSVKEHVEQLKPVKDELGQVIAHLKELFNDK